MLAYKFLRSGAIGPFSGFAWPRPRGDTAGRWVHVDGGLVSCRHGIHSCRLSDLPYWISDELWVIEVADTHVREHHVLARSGRLIRRVSAWDPSGAAAFAEACTWRLRDRVVGALAVTGHAVTADALDECATLDGLRAVTATTTMPAVDTGTYAAAPQAAGHPRHLLGYLTDALGFAADGQTCAVAFIGAHVAARTDGDDAAEHGLQVAWFEELLAAAAPGSRRETHLTM